MLELHTAAAAAAGLFAVEKQHGANRRIGQSDSVLASIKTPELREVIINKNRFQHRAAPGYLFVRDKLLIGNRMQPTQSSGRAQKIKKKKKKKRRKKKKFNIRS